MLRRLSEIDTIVIHCADTPNGDDHYRAAQIDEWHKKRKFKRDPQIVAREAATASTVFAHIGYHYVIEIDGTLVRGRALNEVGAHVENHNKNTIGICLIGRDAFTAAQWTTLRQVIATLQRRLAIGAIVGHSYFNEQKLCPVFDVSAWLDGGMAPLVGHVLPKEKIKWKT